MATVTNYPVKIQKYSILVSNESTRMRIYGEQHNNRDTPIGDIHFLANKNLDAPTKAFINRGGFLKVTYPLAFLPSILILLNQKEDVFFDGHGNFTNLNTKS